MKALVLAGGFPQIALIQELKKRKIFVILADYFDSPVAKKYADRYYQVSTLDIDAIRHIAINENADFVITVCTDQALLTVAKVSEELGLPCYIPYETALNATNKQYMKKKFLEYGIPTAKYAIMEHFDENKISEMAFPLVVKPVDCNSSKGVRKCGGMNELIPFFYEAVRLSRSHNAIIEEFIDGYEVSVDVYVEEGKARVLCVSRSDKIADRDKFVIFRALWPAPVSGLAKQKIQETVQRIAEAFCIQNSPMLIQFLVHGDDAHVIEFSARTGGGVKYLLIKRVSGFDVIKAVVDLTLGEKPHLEKMVSEQKYLVNDFIYCKPDVFDHLEGFEELLAEGYLKDYYVFKWQGAEIRSISNNGDRIAGYTVTADSPEELMKKHEEVRRRIKVISADGEDIIRHDLLTALHCKDGFLYSDQPEENG